MANRSPITLLRTFSALENLEPATSTELFLETTRDVLADYGVTAFVLSRLPRSGSGLAPQILVNGWPGGWLERYAEADHYKFDPVARHCMETDRAFSWDEIPASYMTDRRAAAIPQEAAAFDLREGFCVPLHSPLGVGGLSLAGPLIDFAPGLRSAMRLLAYQLHEFSESRPRKAGVPMLTARELDVLSWIADGKTAEDVAAILAISPHTVGEHLKNVRRKLGTSNNAHSIVRALQAGQLRL